MNAKKGMDKPLHIGLEALLILSDWSGVERLVATQAAALLDRGHRVTIIARELRAKVDRSIPLSRIPENCELLTVDLDSPEGLDSARKKLAEADFDVVVTVCANSDSVYMPWLLNGSGVPTIAAVAHPPDILTVNIWNSYEHYGTLATADYIQTLLEPFHKQYPPALRERVVAIGNPSPPPGEFDRAERAAKSKRTLLGVGRMDEKHKNFSTLIRAWAILAKDFPDWSLTLVGAGPSFAFYKEMAKALPKVPITFTGAVANPDEHYKSADLFCIPSRYEGFGMVMTEAAAWELPLVGLESCLAARELIGPGMGALSPENTPEALAETLRPIMAATPEERQSMGETAQRVLGDRFSHKVIFDKWEELLYNAAMSKGRTRAGTLAANEWDEALMTQAALEIISRPHPARLSADSEDRYPAAAIARLRGELETRRRDYDLLDRKYRELLSRFQELATRKTRR